MKNKSYGDELEVLRLESSIKGNFTVVKSIKLDNGSCNIDIRSYYTAIDGNVLPTKKGIRLYSETAPEIMMAMVKAMDTESRDEFYEAICNYMNNNADE